MSKHLGKIFVILGIVTIIGISYFSYFAQRYYIYSNFILYKLNQIKKEENKLNYNILYTSMFLYSDNDRIANSIHKIKSYVKELEDLGFYKQYFPESYNELKIYKKEFNHKVSLIFEFLRFSLPLKNAMIYLGNGLKYISFKNPNYTKTALNVVSSIFLAKNAVDIDFLKNIDKDLQKLHKLAKSQYDAAFYRNVMVFITYFPEYKKYLHQILNFPTQKYLNKSIEYFNIQVKDDLKIFDILSIALIIFITALIVSLMVLNVKLQKRVHFITFLLENDQLTNLPNRYKFKQDIKNYKQPVVIVFNIDKFKNINDYFGSKTGDEVLKMVAFYLRNYVLNKFRCGKVYRIGADDFAVVFEKKQSVKEIKKIAEDIIAYLEEKSYGENLKIKLSVSAGISFEPPFLENADIALKLIKKDIKEKVGFYNDSMQKDVMVNLRKSNEIKEAIKNENIIPYFQPIVDKDGNVVKFEVLCRIKMPDGEIKSIFPYLEVIKENKMYHKITEMILIESLEKLEENKDLNLSINLMMEDIINEDQYNFIKENYTSAGIANRVTFEILENEINDYDPIQQFVKEMKQYGMTFSIDDFGSGYSNFSRILQLNIDYLKIDGSLIKNIDKDKNSELIVETIVNFAKKSDIKTIAEYVHSKEVFEKTKKIGVDYFQGFYIAEPSEKIIKKVNL
jgi:diguanylate cyclase (GGDEF)-like protein